MYDLIRRRPYFRRFRCYYRLPPRLGTVCLRGLWPSGGILVSAASVSPHSFPVCTTSPAWCCSSHSPWPGHCGDESWQTPTRWGSSCEYAPSVRSGSRRRLTRHLGPSPGRQRPSGTWPGRSLRTGRRLSVSYFASISARSASIAC